LQLWQIREATSFQGTKNRNLILKNFNLLIVFKGCIHSLYINDDPVNFANVDYRHKILPGCENNEQKQLSCTTDTCQHGQCRLDNLIYKCICHEGYTGSTCSQRK
jgi:hypothetical protein